MADGGGPPGFLRLAGHPLRWGLLGELARSDRQVRELTRLLDQPQNLVSYHLGRLRAGGLVTMRRSSADRRDAYYSIDLARCGELLAATGAALHPGLRLTVPVAGQPAPQPAEPVRVLFLCTGNSARSQMAEAFLRRLSGGTIGAFSAGSHPKPLNKNAILAMREHGVDLSGQRSRHLSTFDGQRFDYVVSLCDRLREICPQFPGHPEVIHWSIPDPAAEGGEQAFRRTAAELRGRVEFLIRRIASEHG
jgi:ArsR family transcriptional regulator, arsenate/arsenite/antimonite-responsive transcriptional repressor / arsenate reductase (thioredoxin)